jgi:hypothetical protein
VIDYKFVDLLHGAVIQTDTLNYARWKQCLENFYPEIFEIDLLTDTIKIYSSDAEGTVNEIYFCTIESTECEQS